MSENHAFRELMQRVRDDDPDAWDELVRLYEPHVRRFVRVHLTDERLRCFVDSVDVCQSVLKNLFAAVNDGRCEVDSPEELLKLLAAMAHNRVIDKWRTHRLEIEQTEPGGAQRLPEVPARGDGPPDPDALLKAFLARLAPDERDLIDRHWLLGQSWEELATELGINADALRKQCARAMDRAAGELGL
jgi:RNA polymerase sigma-70 factor (ECF subfamily)